MAFLNKFKNQAQASVQKVETEQKQYISTTFYQAKDFQETKEIIQEELYLIKRGNTSFRVAIKKGKLQPEGKVFASMEDIERISEDTIFKYNLIIKIKEEIKNLQGEQKELKKLQLRKECASSIELYNKLVDTNKKISKHHSEALIQCFIDSDIDLYFPDTTSNAPITDSVYKSIIEKYQSFDEFDKIGEHINNQDFFNQVFTTIEGAYPECYAINYFFQQQIEDLNVQQVYGPKYIYVLFEQYVLYFARELSNTFQNSNGEKAVSKEQYCENLENNQFSSFEEAYEVLSQVFDHFSTLCTELKEDRKTVLQYKHRESLVIKLSACVANQNALINQHGYLTITIGDLTYDIFANNIKADEYISKNYKKWLEQHTSSYKNKDDQNLEKPLNKPKVNRIPLVLQRKQQKREEQQGPRGNTLIRKTQPKEQKPQRQNSKQQKSKVQNSYQKKEMVQQKNQHSVKVTINSGKSQNTIKKELLEQKKQYWGQQNTIACEDMLGGDRNKKVQLADLDSFSASIVRQQLRQKVIGLEKDVKEEQRLFNLIFKGIDIETLNQDEIIDLIKQYLD